MTGSGGLRAPVSPQLQGDYSHVVSMGNNHNSRTNSCFLFAFFLKSVSICRVGRHISCSLCSESVATLFTKHPLKNAVLIKRGNALISNTRTVNLHM